MLAVDGERAADKLDPGVAAVGEVVGDLFAVRQDLGEEFHVLVDVDGAVIAAA